MRRFQSRKFYLLNIIFSGINVSTGKDKLEILKVFARAKFLYSFPTSKTDNMYVSAINPLTGTVKVS